MTVQKLREMTRDDPQTKPPFWIFYAISTYVAWYKRRRSVEMRFPSAQQRNIDTHYHSGFAFFALKKIVIPMYNRYIGTPVWVLCRAA
jgi:hypothetical protein